MILNKYLIFTLVLLPSSTKSCLGDQEPASFLIPPPIQSSQQSKKNQRSIPELQFPTPSTLPPENYNGQTDSSGLMQRFARWFGFGGGSNVDTLNNISPDYTKDQTQYTIKPGETKQAHSTKTQTSLQPIPQASYHQLQYKENPFHGGSGIYHYNPPKANCSPCNKIPWIPMWPGNIPLLSGHLFNKPNLPAPLNTVPYNLASNIAPQTLNTQQLQTIQTQQQHNLDSRNQNQLRAVKFNGPGTNMQLISPPHLFIPPIPVPNLSAIPLPPLYKAQSFRETSNIYSTTSNNLPYIDHIEQPSEIKPVLPTQILPNYFLQQHQFQNNRQKDQDGQGRFEIVRSVPVADYISSIEYPIKVSQSQVIDLTKDNDQSQTNVNINKISFTESQIPKLIELGSFETKNKVGTETIPDQLELHQSSESNKNSEVVAMQDYNQNRNQQSNFETLTNFIQPPEQFDFIGPITSLLPPTNTNPPDFLPSPIIVNNSHESSDNYPEASSYNLTIEQEKSHRIESELESFYSTTTIEPIQENYDLKFEGATSGFDIVPSLETASEYPDLFKDYFDKIRVTTQSPILYNHNDDIFPGKPFTKDDNADSAKLTPWVLQPTPTSTYSSIDASGRYAGMSPPSEFQAPLVKFSDVLTEKRPKQIHQLIIPYTTKIKPSPFKAREKQQQSQYNVPENRYVSWSDSHEYHEIHDQQESKLVTATEITEMPPRKTTKYLTKILASNIRELLRREHAKRNNTNNDNILDSSEKNLKHLQNNIDGWTEQEFTSLKHKASTVSLHKPSKNIPNEYLTTTQSLHEFKNLDPIGVTTQNPSTSTISVTKPMKTSTMLSSKDDFMAHLEDNSIYSFVTNNKNRLEVYTKSYMKNKSSTTTTIRPETTSATPNTTSTTTVRPLTSTLPFYHRNIRPTKTYNERELWQKLKVSISPLTNEKIYVVTPVPRFQTKGTTSIDDIGAFKSPRFIVRPAPALHYNTNSTSELESTSQSNKNEISNTIKKSYTPELFGLMGISAFVPDEPADILDGHSRVITVVTPTPHNKKRSIKYVELKRSTKVLPLQSGLS